MGFNSGFKGLSVTYGTEFPSGMEIMTKLFVFYKEMARDTAA